MISPRYLAAFASYVGLAVGIGGDQPIADIGDIELAVGEALPGMRIGDGLGLAALLLDHGARLHARRGDDHLALEARGFLQSLHPPLEAEAVDEQDLRGREVLGVGRRRLIDMRVAIRPDQRDDIDAVAADLLHHVAEDAERGDSSQFMRCLGTCREAKNQSEGQGDLHRRAMFHDCPPDYECKVITYQVMPSLRSNASARR